MRGKIKPFWLQIHRCFLHPFNTIAILLITAFSIIPLFISMVKNQTSSWTIIISAGFIFSVYIFSVLQNVKEGIPILTTKTSIKLKASAFFLTLSAGVLLFGLGYLFNLSAQIIGQYTPHLFFSLITLIFPAVIMLLATTQNLFIAFNPIRLLQFIFSIFKSYLILLAFIIMLEGGLLSIYQVTSEFLEPNIVGCITTFFGLYLLNVAFYMMGYLLYQHHETLSKFTSQHTKNEYLGQTIDDLEINAILLLIRDNQPIRALKALEDALERNPDNIEAHKIYHEQLLQGKDKKKLFYHAQIYLWKLVARGHSYQAVDVYKDIIKKHPDFKVSDIDLSLKIAQAMYKLKQFNLMINILSDLHLISPEHHSLPEAYLLLATVLSEHYSKDIIAKKILEYILAKHPAAHLVPNIQSKLEEVNKLIANS